MKSNSGRHCCIRLPSYRSVLSYTIVNAARPCAANGSWRRRVKSPAYVGRPVCSSRDTCRFIKGSRPSRRNGNLRTKPCAPQFLCFQYDPMSHQGTSSFHDSRVESDADVCDACAIPQISSHICICSPLTRQLIRCRKKTSTLAQKIGGSREHRLGCAGLFSKAQQESKENVPLFVKFAFVLCPCGSSLLTSDRQR